MAPSLVPFPPAAAKSAQRPPSPPDSEEAATIATSTTASSAALEEHSSTQAGFALGAIVGGLRRNNGCVDLKGWFESGLEIEATSPPLPPPPPPTPTNIAKTQHEAVDLERFPSYPWGMEFEESECATSSLNKGNDDFLYMK